VDLLQSDLPRGTYCIAQIDGSVSGSSDEKGDAEMVDEEKIPRITIDELKKLTDQKSDVLIVDTHPKGLYEKHHIKGAVSIPWAMLGIAWEDAQKLPKDKGKLIVTYCDCGPGESDSAEIAGRLIQMGYTNVKVLADPALKGWEGKGYPVETGA
jgi:rhodanese-related sulfurtransferase